MGAVRDMGWLAEPFDFYGGIPERVILASGVPALLAIEERSGKAG